MFVVFLGLAFPYQSNLIAWQVLRNTVILCKPLPETLHFVLHYVDLLQSRKGARRRIDQLRSVRKNLKAFPKDRNNEISDM